MRGAPRNRPREPRARRRGQVLVTIVAVFLAYNANNGLPFVPTTELKVRIANGAELVRGNEVRSGGYRVGVVADIKPVELRDGRVGAELTLKLDKTIGKIPVDSRWRIRPRSALGLKYVELNRGHARSRRSTTATRCPLEQTEIPSTSTTSSRCSTSRRAGAQQENLRASATRSPAAAPSLGRTIEEAAAAVRPPRAGRCATSPTRRPSCRDFFKELGDAARVVAPVSETNARLFTTMADTFEADRPRPGGAEGVHRQEPADARRLDGLAPGPAPVPRPPRRLLRRLRRRDAELRGALPDINSALESGTACSDGADTNERLEDTFTALGDLTVGPARPARCAA